MARRKFAKPVAKYPAHGQAGDRWLREGKYNKRTGQSEIGWLIHHSTSFSLSSAKQISRRIIKDYKGKKYRQLATGAIIKITRNAV